MKTSHLWSDEKNPEQVSRAFLFPVAVFSRARETKIKKGKEEKGAEERLDGVIESVSSTTPVLLFWANQDLF